MAEKIAEELGYGIPPKREVVASKRLPKSGIMARMFASSYVDGAGNLRFKDHGSWGNYIGDLDDEGKRQGKGKMIFDEGGSYEGEFKDNKFHGFGIYKWYDNEEYEGEWKDNERNGKGIYRSKDGSVEYTNFANGSPVGEGIKWSPDRQTAKKLKDGDEGFEMLPEEAEKFAREKFDLPVPEVSDIKPAPVHRGLLARLFDTGPRFDENGKLMYKDNGDWGTWSGEVDSESKRKGTGVMAYESEAVYEGNFVNDLYEDETGQSKYTWNDGEYYIGQWKKGERNGKGVYYSLDGSVEVSMYENGRGVGQGIKWSPNRKSAFRLVDGKQSTEISLGVAEKEAKEKFDMAVPEMSKITPPENPDGVNAKPTQPGLFQRIFKGAPPLDEDGNPMFRDNSDWGSYIGERDANGHRSGKGKITYQSGAVYEGGFVNNKYEGEGTYTWDDGDEYVGEWKNGERNGKGTFTHSDGTVELSIFDNGSAVGEGVHWSPDRKTAWKLVDGDKKMEMLPDEAKQFATEKFNAPVPEVSTAPPKKSRNVGKETPGLFARMWNKYDADGNLMYKDNGDWGSWEGELDSNGKRTGKGKMTYECGASYEGDFVNDKYEGHGTYTWDDGDNYTGEWKDGKRNGKGAYRQMDGIVEYCIFDYGRPKGEGIAWEPDRKSAFRLKDGERTLEMLVEEAEKLSKEKFDLPIPEYYKPTRERKSEGGFFSFFKSSKQVAPIAKPQEDSPLTVETWLQSQLPNLNSSDLQTYSKQLLDDGFDSVEMLNHLEVGDLGFMKKAHQRVLVEKLKEKK
jgi:hypothetical protein